MRIFKKLQENSLYWRYRFVTRRWLAARRWWRTLRQQRVHSSPARLRGLSGFSPYQRGAIVNGRRGIAFALILAVAWTVVSVAARPHETFLVALVRLAVLAAVVYAFDRFW